MTDKPLKWEQRIPSEFEVQAYLFYNLRELGYQVQGEYRHDGCRFDLFVALDDLPIRIIEVKKVVRKSKHRSSWRSHTKDRDREWQIAREYQVNRYSAYGVIVDVVCGMDEAVEYIQLVKEKRLNATGEGNHWCSLLPIVDPKELVEISPPKSYGYSRPSWRGMR